MRNLIGNSNKGYILLDILIGLFIFGLGFTVIIGLTSIAALAKGQTDNYLDAINLASSTMDEILSDLEEDSSFSNLYLSINVKDRIGTFERAVKSEWESSNLLLILVEIKWVEKGQDREYLLESLYYVQEE